MVNIQYINDNCSFNENIHLFSQLGDIALHREYSEHHYALEASLISWQSSQSMYNLVIAACNETKSNFEPIKFPQIIIIIIIISL